MKFQASILFLAAVLSPAVLALPASPEDTEVVEADSAPHSDSGAAVVNPGVDGTLSQEAAAAAPQKCISFTSTNSNWYYANAGVWGTGKGKFGTGTKRICVNRNNNAGGAMFIGTKENPSAGNTKLECYFPSSGQANCDVSLVDGYSLSVTCKAGGKTIGGSTNLWKTGQTCHSTSLLGQGICKNDRGNAPVQNDVTEFFQQGIKHGNHYCIWKNCKQDYFFDSNADITCHVSGGR